MRFELNNYVKIFCEGKQKRPLLLEQYIVMTIKQLKKIVVLIKNIDKEKKCA